MPYPQALNRPKAKNSETHDNVLDAFKKVTITIPLIDAIKHIPSYAKFLKGICTPHRNPKRIQLSETVSSIMMNSLPVKKRDPGAPMITSEIGGMSFTRSDEDSLQQMNTRPPLEPRYDLRKRTHPQLQQHAILFLIKKLEDLTIHEVSDEDFSKSLKESVDPMGITFPPLPFIN